jgi:hypothetical protein
VVGQVEALEKSTGIRVALPPSSGPGPVLVELEYAVPASRARGAWHPPKLVGDAVVQQTLWEVRLPWNLAAVGVPTGWCDENEWHWDVYVWKRRPWMAPGVLASWAGVSTARASTEGDSKGDSHGYLFGRAGGPTDLSITVASRALLVAVCSGTVLAVGALLILVWRPPGRLIWVAVPAFILAVAALLHPSVTFLAVQSGMVGVVLTASIALMQKFFVGRRSGPVAYGDPNGRAAGVAPGSTLSRTVGVGSDDSTAIRVRPVSTMDYLPTPPASSGAEAGTGSSRSEPSTRGGAAP